MKKLFFTLLLAAATLPGWADETQLTIIGGATSAGWATGTGTEETRVLERTVGRMVRTAANTWVWVGTLTTGDGDNGNFKITNGAGANDWDGYWATSADEAVGGQDTKTFNLATANDKDKKFHVTTTGMYRITVDLSQSTKKMKVDKLSAPTQDANGYYQIGTADQFMWFAGKVTSEESSSLKAKLTADISFSGKNFFPLACEKHQFKGELDGAGHTIDYAVINDPRDIVGIFRYLAPGANVHDLVIGSNCSFTGSNNVGGIAGVANGTGTVTLSKVINAATIHANNKENGTNAAGFVAFADGATVNVTNCANLGQTSTNGEGAKSAAFIGWIATSASFTNCWNGGTINDMDGTNNLYRTGDTQTITVDNCYDVSGGNYGQGTQLATTAKGTGELCYKLNGDQSNIKWYQTLHGTDSYPYLLDTHKQVYQVSETSYSNLSVVDGKVQISDADDLVTFSAEVNAGNTALNAVLTNDIDMTGINDYTPIGTADNLYSGTFDGDTHRIKNLVINNNIKEQGLFSVCTNATIKNLIMDASCSIKSTNGAWGNAAFVAVCNGTGTLTFENCGNEASVEGAAGNNAAFLGKNYSSGLKTVLTNCYNTGTIKGGGYNAAFVGESNGKEVTTTNCYNKGNVVRSDDGNTTWINGNGTKNITNCYTTLSSGALSGLNTSYSEEKITSGELCYLLNDNTSGGTNWTQTIGTDTYPIPFNTSMLVFKNGTEYDNIEKDGGWYKISNANELKLFSSKVNAGSPALNAKLTKDIDMSGVNDYTPIGPSDNRKKYKGTFDGQNHYIKFNINNDSGTRLGLIGFATAGAYVKNLIIKGSIRGKQYVGGFVGSLSKTDDQSGTMTFENCGNEADITVTDINAGGLLGCSFNSEVKVVMKNCYSTGIIKSEKGSDYQCGQLTAWSTNTQIENCYTIGNSDKCDPFARLGSGTNTITNCYSDKDLTWTNHPTYVTTEQIASGELCYKLGGAFTQDLSQDGHPTFASYEVKAGKWFNDASNDVYYNEIGGNITVNQLNLDDTKTVYNVPANVTAKNVKMTTSLHQLTANGENPRWNTFCSPVALPKDGNFSKIKELTGVSVNGDNYTMTFNDASSIEPGITYMVQVASPNPVFTATDATVATAASTSSAFSGLTFNGTFNKDTAPLNSFIISDNVFYQVDQANTVNLKAFRGYITVESDSGVKALTFDFDDDATGIKTLSDSPLKGENIYNLAGQRLLKAQKGINIVNGKKILK